MSKTDTQEAADLNLAAMSNLFVGLITTSPTTAALETGTAVEATTSNYTSYARQAVTLGTVSGSGDDASTPTTRANTNAITFPVWPAGGVVYQVVFYNQLSGGAALYYADGFSSVTVSAGTQPTFVIGSLTLIEK